MRDFKFDIDTGVGSFIPGKDEPVDLSKVESDVKESGFDLLWLEVRVRGILESATDPTGTVRPSVRADETDQRFLLYEGKSEEERQGYARLAQWFEGPARKVIVEGRVHSHVGAPAGLTVRTFRLLEESP